MTSIKLLGVPSKSYLLLKEILNQVLELTEAKVSLEEVNVIDEILSYEVGSIPVVLVDNQICFEKNGHLPDINELTYLLSNKIKNSET